MTVQQLRFHASNAWGAVSIPGQGTKILHAAWGSQKITNLKQKRVILHI